MKTSICVFLTFLMLELHAQPLFPTDPRADSIEIVHTHIRLRVTQTATPYLFGHATLTFVPSMPMVNALILDFKSLQIDSCSMNGAPHSYQHSQDLLILNLPSYQLGDTLTADVYYQGSPYNDGGFGGVYFQQQIAYNMGVSFSDLPHGMGRTWFPCLDNFTSRSSYTLEFETPPLFFASGSGKLVSTATLPNGNSLYRYEHAQPIPSYLLSFAIGNYTTVDSFLMGIYGDTIPLRLAAKPSDTTQFKMSAIHLQPALSIFEQSFGKFEWDLIGYVLVPASAGAMEHSGNIAYPASIANGTLDYEDILVHELAHCWWGNLATCETSEDMWLNEGFAVFSELLFNEIFYGRETAMAKYRNKHKTNIQRAHISDQGYWPLSGVPNNHTYGMHSYQKGAGAIHSLRHWLGDTLFFNALKFALAQNQYKHWNSETFRMLMEQSAQTSLQPFFQDFIYTGGWVNVQLDSFGVQSTGSQFFTSLYIKQGITGRTSPAQTIPITVRYYQNPSVFLEEKIWISAQQYTYNAMPLPFNPIHIVLNADEGMSLGQTSQEKLISQPGVHNLNYANFNLSVQQVTDSLWIHVTQYYSAAQPDDKGRVVSPQRWWRVRHMGGIPLEQWNATASLGYNGRITGNNSHLDHLLLNGSEDSLLLLWKPLHGNSWIEYPYYTQNIGSSTDLLGSINLSKVLPGDYTFAKGGPVVSNYNHKTDDKYHFFPSPLRAGDYLHLTLPGSWHPSDKMMFVDVNGRNKALVQSPDFNQNGLKIPDISPGIYILVIQNEVLNTRYVFDNKLIIID
jgi:aminopeptidase N